MLCASTYYMCVLLFFDLKDLSLPRLNALILFTHFPFLMDGDACAECTCTGHVLTLNCSHAIKENEIAKFLYFNLNLQASDAHVFGLIICHSL